MAKSNYSCWDEAVFEFRNKNYGAYSLRSNYPLFKSFAAFIVLLMFMGGMIGPTLFSEKEVNNHIAKKVLVINFNELTAPPPIEKIYIPPKKVIVEKAEVKKYVAPVVTKEEVKEEIITVQEVKETPPAPPDAEEGDGDMVVQAAPPPEEVKIEPPKPIVAVRPQFPGGIKELQKFLQRKLRYPPLAESLGISGKVLVEFTVGIDGSLTDITIIQSIYKSCDDEAIRVVKLMPPWTPGESNTGEKLSVRVTVPFSFKMQ